MTPRQIAIVKMVSDLVILIINRKFEPERRLAMAFALPAGSSITLGDQQIITLSCMRVDKSDTSPLMINFEKSIIPRQMVGVDAIHLRPSGFRGVVIPPFSADRKPVVMLPSVMEAGVSGLSEKR